MGSPFARNVFACISNCLCCKSNDAGETGKVNKHTGYSKGRYASSEIVFNISKRMKRKLMWLERVSSDDVFTENEASK